MPLALVFLLLPVCAFAPGFFFVRRLRWSPLEKLCGAVGLSLVLVFLVCWAIYCFGAPAEAYFAVSAASAALGFAACGDIRRLGRSSVVRRAAAGFGFLLVWTVLILAMIRVYSGGAWCIDWMEHFQRSLFFLHRFPLETPVWGNCQLPARPPMMNVLGAFFLAQTRDDFAIHQVVFTFLNLLLFLPCCLMLPALAGGRRSRRAMLILTALFAMSPVVIENATYPWTKSLAAFYAVLALWLYLAGWRKNDPVRTAAAFLAAAAGLLVHYSLGPYCVFLALHYLLRVFPKRPRKWRELAAIATVCGALLASWFGWSLASYGAKATFASNSAVTSSREFQGRNIAKIGANLRDSIVPALFQHPKYMRMYRQPNRAGYVRDAAFSFYQLNLIFAMGLAGGPAVLWLLYRAVRRRLPPAGKAVTACPTPERVFWLLLIPVAVVSGIAVIGERNPFGAAHLTLLPLEVLGLSLLAAAFPRRRAAAALLLAGCAVDFSLGVFLQARMESLENAPGQLVFTVAVDKSSGLLVSGDPTPSSLSPQAFANWYEKHRFDTGERWKRDLAARRLSDPGNEEFWSRAYALIEAGMGADVDFWHGWFARHGNTALAHLGDLAASRTDPRLNTPAAALLLLFAGLMWAFARVVFRPGRG